MIQPAVPLAARRLPPSRPRTPAGRLSSFTLRPASSSPSSSSPPSAPQLFTSLLYCASLQDRAPWTAVVPLLQASRHVEPRWQRAHLGSHDLAVHLQQPDGVAGVFRFVLVAPGDVGQPATTQRLQRLRQRRNGLGGAVLFLLDAADSRGSMAAYQQLQADLVNAHLPILPLTTVGALPTILTGFCSQLGARPPENPRHQDGQPVSLAAAPSSGLDRGQ